MSDFAMGVVVGAIAATLVARIVRSVLGVVVPIAVVVGAVVLVAGPDRSQLASTAGPAFQRIFGLLIDWSGSRAGAVVDLLKAAVKL